MGVHKKWGEEYIEHLREISRGRTHKEITMLMNDKFDYQFNLRQIRNLMYRNGIVSNTPKGAKLCFFTKSIRNFIAKRDTKNETTIPTPRSKSSAPVATKPSRTNFITLSSDAPSITGIAIKKENSALATLETPVIIPPRMVEPERDVPGISEST